VTTFSLRSVAGGCLLARRRLPLPRDPNLVFAIRIVWKTACAPEIFLRSLKMPTGFLWLGTDAGPGSFRWARVSSPGERGGNRGSHDDNIFALLSGRDGSLWVGFRNGMVTRIIRASSGLQPRTMDYPAAM